MSEVLGYSEFMEALDAVNPKAVKKKFKDRKDKDIDNDGDVDASDKYLHKRRKAISKAVKNEEKKCPPGQYYCEKSGKCKPNSMKEGAFYGRDDLVKKFKTKNPRDFIRLSKTVMTKDGKPGGTETVSMKRKGNEDKIAKYKKDGYKEVPMESYQVDFLYILTENKGVAEKAKKSGIPKGILMQVFKRGMAAYGTGHRPGASQQQWAFARVNSFIGKGKGTWGGADKDLAAKARKAMKKESLDEDAKDVLKRMRQTRDNLKKQGNNPAGLAAIELRIKKFRDSMKGMKEDLDEMKDPRDFVKLRYVDNVGPRDSSDTRIIKKTNTKLLSKYKSKGYKVVGMGGKDSGAKRDRSRYTDEFGKEDDKFTRSSDKKQNFKRGLMTTTARKKVKEESLDEKGKGLYYNINKKRKEGRPMRKKGEKGAPTKADFDSAARTAKEERELCHSKDHDCATVVEHIVWGFGKPLYESHAIPTDDGYVAWYDVEFEHGIEREVPTEDLKIYTTEKHLEAKGKDKKKMLPAKKGKHSDDKEMDEEKYTDAEIKRAVDIAKKMAGSNYTGAHNAINKIKKGLASVGKVQYALRKAAESFETWKGLSISEVNDLIASAQDYIKLVEDGDLKSVEEPKVEIAKGMPLSFKQFQSKIGD